MNMNTYMFAGVVVGAIVGLVIARVLLRMVKINKNQKWKYDERQKVARGEAYKLAFYVLVCYNLLYGLVDMTLERPWAEELTAMMIGVCLAVLVHIVYSVLHECYFSMNEEPKRVLVIFGVIMVVNVVIAIGQGMRGELIQNGMLTNACANLVAGIMFFGVMIAVFVKWRITKPELED